MGNKGAVKTVVAEGVGRGMAQQFRVSRCKAIIQRMDDKVPAPSTGNDVQYPGISHDGKEYERECTYTYIDNGIILLIYYLLFIIIIYYYYYLLLLFIIYYLLF